MQCPEETFIDFLNDVIKLASFCDFEAKNRMIRDQIIVGMRDSTLRDELFQLGNPKLDDLLEYLIAIRIHSTSESNELDNENGLIVTYQKKVLNQEENTAGNSCDAEFHEDCSVSELDISALNETFPNENIDWEVPVSNFVQNPTNFNYLIEDQTTKGDLPKSNNNENSSTSTSCHDCILKSKVVENVGNKDAVVAMEVENLNLSNIDKSLTTSGNRDMLFCESKISSNQYVPVGSEDDEYSADDEIIELFETEERKIIPQEKCSGLKIKDRIIKREPETKNTCEIYSTKLRNKIVQVIELDDSDEEDIEEEIPNSSTENLQKTIEEPRENFISEKVSQEHVNNFARNDDSPIDDNVYNANAKSLKKKTEVKVEQKKTTENKILRKSCRKRDKKRIHRLKNCHMCNNVYKNRIPKPTSKKCIEKIQHSGEKYFVCSKCFKSFTNQSDLLNHLTTHCKEKSCFNKGLLSKGSSKEHAIMHSRNGFFKCNKCDKYFLNKTRFNIHLAVHGKKIFKCDFCGARFSTKGYLYIHVVKHLAIYSEEKEFSCDYCGKVFFSRHSIYKHITSHLFKNLK